MELRSWVWKCEGLKQMWIYVSWKSTRSGFSSLHTWQHQSKHWLSSPAHPLPSSSSSALPYNPLLRPLSPPLPLLYLSSSIDMARYMTEWPKMCLTYLMYLMCLRIWDGLYYFCSEPYLTYLLYLTYSLYLRFPPKHCLPRIWRIYVFTYLRFFKKLNLTPYLTCLCIWDFCQQKKLGTYLTYSRVYVFEIFAKKNLPPI